MFFEGFLKFEKNNEHGRDFSKNFPKDCRNRQKNNENGRHFSKISNFSKKSKLSKMKNGQKLPKSSKIVKKIMKMADIFQKFPIFPKSQNCQR